MRSGAGSSAREAYQVARAQRRRRVIAVSGLVLLAAATLGAALRPAAPGRVPAAAAGAVCLVLAWLVRPAPDPERWLRGAIGEEATARALDRLSPRRWVVRHDLRIPGSRANVDHLLIGRTGVWVVDTKTTRARVQAQWGTVRVGSRRLDPGPIQWEAQVVTDRLGVPARPLIVVHGRGLRRWGGRCGGVRVVPISGLTRRLRRGRRRLTATDVAGLADRADAVFWPRTRHPEKGGGRRG
jgi:hypothetical protein